MKKLSRITLVLVIALLLIIVPLSTSCTSTDTSGAKTLKIGIMVDLTGGMSVAGIPQLTGAKLWQDWYNSKGGMTINGQKYIIELVSADSKTSPDGATSAATDLVEKQGIKFVVGGLPTFEIVTEGAVTEQNKVLRAIFYGSGNDKEMNAQTPYTFRTYQGILDPVEEVAKFMHDQYPNVKNVALSAPDDGAAQVVFAAQKKALTALGMQIVGSETFTMDTQDFNPFATKLLSYKPEAIFQGSGNTNMQGGIFKGVRQMGFKGPFVTSGPVPITDILAVAGKDLADGFYGTSIIEDNSISSTAKDVYKLIKDKKVDATFTDVATAWDSLWCMCQAIEKAQSLDPTVVAKTWEKMDKIETCFGTGKMGGQATYGVNHVVVRPIPISQLKAAQVSIVKWTMPIIP
jgi:branched-chain amino acid transport system substrate-binding protein